MWEERPLLSDNVGAFKYKISESVEKEVDDEDGATQQLIASCSLVQNNHVMYHVFLYMRTCVTSCFQNWLMAVGALFEMGVCKGKGFIGCIFKPFLFIQQRLYMRIEDRYKLQIKIEVHTHTGPSSWRNY